MPEQSSKKPKRPRDLSLLAKKLVEIATEGEPAEEPSDKNPHAVALGRLGGKKGGKARAAKLSPEERKEIARKAARARWEKKPKP
ncbi:MAG: hypothetical protein FJ134_12885 [Deltaproteobacteria bacterium]|nr:hypothetical protein [Deltaproteobacteria bacterium]